MTNYVTSFYFIPLSGKTTCVKADCTSNASFFSGKLASDNMVWDWNSDITETA